jgi:hypothetical protein
MVATSTPDDSSAGMVLVLVGEVDVLLPARWQFPRVDFTGGSLLQVLNVGWHQSCWGPPPRWQEPP